MKPLLRKDSEVGINREVLLFDFYYKRVLTDVIMYRERQIPFLPSEVTHLKAPIVQPSRARFADQYDWMPLVLSFGVGTMLLVFVQSTFPNQ